MSNLNKTDIKWLPFISSDYSIARVKDVFYRSKIKAKQNNPVVLSLARDAIKIRDISTNEGQLAESYFDYNVVEPGDLLLNPMDLYSGANCNMSLVNGVISQAYINLRTSKNINPKYYDYYFKTQYWNMGMFAHGKGVSYDNRWTLNLDTLLNYEIPLPSKQIQDKIVDILTYKLSRVDKLIQDSNLIITKIKEYMPIYLNDFFNKLKINKKNKLLYVAKQICSGSTPKSGNDKFYFGDINWIQSGDIDDDIYYTNKKVTSYALENISALKLIKPPFLVVAMYGASIGHVGISHIEACTNQACCNMKFNNLIQTKFYYYYLLANKEALVSDGQGGTQPNISQEKVKQFYVPIVNDLEAEMVTNRIESSLKKFNELISILTDKIKKLNEYKKSLIYEYVTGKKEV